MLLFTPPPPTSRRQFLSLLPNVALCSLYDRYAADYNRLDGATLLTRTLGIDSSRRELLANARGDVLEAGAGTGVNRPFYPPLKSYTGLDASAEMLRIANKVDLDSAWVLGDVEDMQFENHSFDTVVDTFSLCVYQHPLRALREMRRVLRPNGSALLLEHTASENDLLRWYQDLTSQPSAKLSKGCVGNQRVEQLCEEAGFRVLNRKHYIAGTVVALHLGV